MRVQRSVRNTNYGRNLFRCLAVAAALSWAAVPTRATVCVVPDNGTGTADMPPQCPNGYQSPDDVHEIIDGLPPGTTIIIDASHTKFGLTSSGAGGNLGGEFERFNSLLILNMRGTGALQGFARTLFLPVQAETHIGPRTPGNPVQSFPTEMVQLQGEIFGDPDFDLLRVTGGTSFGLPSPGHTTLTQLPSGDWAVDSFFDITYNIDFQGAPGSVLAGMAGTTARTLRMQAGQATEPDRFSDWRNPTDPTLPQSGISFGTADVPAIPANFFGLGSQPFVGDVPLVGEPLGVATGPVDTMIQRPFDPLAPSAPVGSVATVPIEIVALSLKSAAPITVGTDTGLTSWDLHVTLSPDPQQQGSMTVQKTQANGGTFSADLPVIPLLTFTNQGNPADVRVLVPPPTTPPIQLIIPQGDWVHTVDPALNVQPTSNQFYPGVLEVAGTQTPTLVRANSTGGGVTHIVCPPPPPPPPDDHATWVDPANPNAPVTTVTIGGPAPQEIPAIPADFFGLGSLPFEGTVVVEGDNFGPNSDASVRLQRTDDPVKPSDPVGATGTVGIELVQLSLVSADPITVSFADGTSSNYRLRVRNLGSSGLDGVMTATKTHPNGGTYTASFDLPAELLFELDLGAGLFSSPLTLPLANPLRMSISGSWVHNVDPALGLVVPPGQDTFTTGIEHEDIGIAQRVQVGTARSAGGAVSHVVCPPRPLACRPTADQLRCEPGTCPGTTDPCVPIRWRLDANGQWLVLECNCVTQNQCHFDPFLPTGPGCTGGCPGLADVCREFAVDSDGDGIADTFSCECLSPPPGACCLADGTCAVAATAADCVGKFHPATSCLGDLDGDGIDDLCQASECSQCPAGPHWIDLSPCPLVDPDSDTFGSAAKLGIDLDGDCIADTNLVMFGPATVLKRGPVDDSVQFPGLRPVDGHKDVVDTEMLAMNLTGGGATMIAGAGLGAIPLPASLGAVAELPTDPSSADSFFDVFVELSGGGLAGPAYNQTPIRVQTTVSCLPPKGKYIHITGCTPIFDSPIPGLGVQVGNLVSAMHFTFPDCCNVDGTCAANVPAPVCKQNGGTPVPACLGDSNLDGLDDACSPPADFCPEPAGQDWCAQRKAIDCIPDATNQQFCEPRVVSFGAVGLSVDQCDCFDEGPGCGPVVIRPILGTADVEFSCKGVCPDGVTNCQIILGGTATGLTSINGSATGGASVICGCPPAVCEPDPAQSGCAPVTCPAVGDSCSRTCVNYNPATGVALTTQCDCKGPNECHVVTAGAVGGAVAAVPPACVLPDNTTGTVTLPPVGCDYLSADEVHEIIDGLPAGTTIELAAIHKDFICADQPGGATGGVCSFTPNPLVNCDEPGGSLGGEKECRKSTLQLNVTGSCPGTLCGFSRLLSIPNVSFETHTGPRTPGDAVQSFDTDMFRLQGELFGDPDFCTLRLTAGSDFGLPSPGHVTLTRQGAPGGDFQVDSFFDITYRIDFQGCPGSVLGGMAGSTTGTVRMQTGAPTCKGTCPPGDVCEETRTPRADGTVDICCTCVTPPSVCEPLLDGSACKPNTCADATQTCLPRVIEVSSVCSGTTTPCTTDADCPAAGTTCVKTSRVVECDCVDPTGCHVDFDAVTQAPFCTGTCPTGQTCDLFGADIDGDNVFDQFHCECVTPPACKPNAAGTACEQFVCPGPVPPTDACQAKCALYDPLTGLTQITDCACAGVDDCHIVLPNAGVAGAVAAAEGTVAAAAGSACTVPDNGGGTVTLPPAGCDYLTADEVHQIADGLPAGTTFELAAIHKDFICLRDPATPSVCSFTPPAFGVDCDEPGGTFPGGEKECSESKLHLQLTGSCPGPLCGYVRVMVVPATFEVHTAPRTGGDPVQTFETDMFRLQGQIFGDPDFDLLKVTAGTDFGLPSPGHTTLTKLPSGDFQVDSFFDITYTIEFHGAIGGALSGLSGSTTGGVRMQTGAPSCKGNCPANTRCNEKRTPHIGADGTPDGRVDICCECVPICLPSKRPRADTILDTAGVTVTSAKNRFLSFAVGESGLKAVRVKIVNLWGTFSALNGLTYWVDVPFVASELGGKTLTDPVGADPTFLAAPFRPTPQYMDWSALGIVHVFDERIIPSRQRAGVPVEPAIYDIQVIDVSCDPADEASYSPALQITNPKWGDTSALFGGAFLAPDGVVSIDDVLAFIAKFGGASNAPIKSRAELLGVTTGPVAAIDGALTVSDLLEILSAFGGGAYPFPSPGP